MEDRKQGNGINLDIKIDVAKEREVGDYILPNCVHEIDTTGKGKVKVQLDLMVDIPNEGVVGAFSVSDSTHKCDATGNEKDDILLYDIGNKVG